MGRDRPRHSGQRGEPPTAAALVADLRRALVGRLVVRVTHDPAVAGERDSRLLLVQHVSAAARR